MPGFRAETWAQQTCQGRLLMDVLLFQACGVWQTSSCYSVTLLGFALHKHQHIAKQTKMLSSQAFYKTPHGGGVVEEYICLLNQAPFFHLKR